MRDAKREREIEREGKGEKQREGKAAGRLPWPPDSPKLFHDYRGFEIGAKAPISACF